MQILKYKQNQKENSSLKAWITIQIPKWEDFIIEDIQVFQKENRKWINLPNRPYEDNGEKKYFNLNRFAKPETFQKFSAEVLKTLETYIQEKITPETQMEMPF